VTVNVYVPPEVAETLTDDVREVVDEVMVREEELSVTLRPGEGFGVSATVPVNPFTLVTVTPPRLQGVPAITGQ
jgi:hypothetical protein